MIFRLISNQNRSSQAKILYHHSTNTSTQGLLQPDSSTNLGTRSHRRPWTVPPWGQASRKTRQCGPGERVTTVHGNCPVTGTSSTCRWPRPCAACHSSRRHRQQPFSSLSTTIHAMPSISSASTCLPMASTLWRSLLPYGYSYKASCARPG